ncbi:MAG: dihydroorotate dehydrogenase [bacterium]|nr:dihydroorotate dehydrogenase [bacterium]
MSDLSINLAGIRMKNPVMVASGTFGYGDEYAKLVDINRLGALVTKTITVAPRFGNPPPRLVETPAGMLNSIGLQNIGIHKFISDKLPILKKFITPIIVSIAGESVAEFVQLAEMLSAESGIAGLEMNISCPNVKSGGMLFGIDPELTREVVSAVRKSTKLPLLVKLTPNVTDITLIGRSAVDAGADALVAINTLLGMVFDTKTGKPKLGNLVGGLSGPAIRPIAVRMVYELAKTVTVPIIGTGGIMNTDDALEFFYAGAKAVSIGTGIFVDPQIPIKIIDGLTKLHHSHK